MVRLLGWPQDGPRGVQRGLESARSVLQTRIRSRMRCAGATETRRYHRARMVFSSVTFLFFFLPAVLIAYYVVPHGARNALLVLASLVFYTWGAGWIVLVLIASIGLNGVFGLGVERSMEAGLRGRAQVILAIAIAMNVG